jgi:predicted Mrr-cat superfamily restriction endonuclease
MTTGQVGAFLFKMKPRDLVAVPRKGKAAFAIGEIQGDYRFEG